MIKKTITVAFTLLLSFGGSSCWASEEAADTRLTKPNIIFLLTDDQRADAVGYAGNEIIKTPNLDKLAFQGTHFKNAFVTTAICCVSRACILTGQYARFSGVQDFFTPIKLETTYPHYLRANGYYTGFVGKWGTLETNLDYFKESADLFDFWAGSMGQSNFWHERTCNFVNNNGTTDKQHFHCDCPEDARGFKGEEIRVGKKGLKDPVHQETYVIPKKIRSFLDQRDEGKPFCLSISFKSPHDPWSDYDDKRYAQDYEGVQMPVAETVSVEDALKRPEFLRKSLNGFNRLEELRDARKIDSYVQRSTREYYRLVNGMDFAVGELVAELEARGLADNTVIIFYSDNGHFMKEHGFRGKWLMYEESIRVPGFIYDPRNKKDAASKEEFVLNIDIAPTILELAGIDKPAHMNGESWLPLIDGTNDSWREDLFYEHNFFNVPGPKHIERSEGVRTKDWKYINYINQAGDEAEELYNVTEDPLEQTDLSGNPEFQAVLERLRLRYEKWFF